MAKLGPLLTLLLFPVYLLRGLWRVWAWTLRLDRLPRSCWTKRSSRPGDFFSPGTVLFARSAAFLPGRPGFRLFAMVDSFKVSESHPHGGSIPPRPSTRA